MSTTTPTLQDVLDAVKKIGSDMYEFKNESKENFRSLSEEMQGIKNQVDARIDTCEANIDHLSYEVECIKQRQLKCNITIGGIPATPNENLLNMFTAICNVINFNCPNELVTGIYRTTGRAKQSIIVQLANESVKFGILNAKKIKKAIILEELDTKFHDSKSEIIINQQLTPFFGNLLYKARQAKAKGHIAECWFSMKGIFIKPQKTSNAVQIKSVAELATFLPVESTTDTSCEQPLDQSSQHKRKASSEINNASKKTNDIPSNTIVPPNVYNPPSDSAHNQQINGGNNTLVINSTPSQGTNKPPTQDTQKIKKNSK